MVLWNCLTLFRREFEILIFFEWLKRFSRSETKWEREFEKVSKISMFFFIKFPKDFFSLFFLSYLSVLSKTSSNAENISKRKILKFSLPISGYGKQHSLKTGNAINAKLMLMLKIAKSILSWWWWCLCCSYHLCQSCKKLHFCKKRGNHS